MTEYTRDRLWTRPSTLTDEEREAARRAYEQQPSILDAAVLAALGHIDHGERLAARIAEEVRR